ncbi:MAG: TdeIII family type II restriction endonuclease [Pyrinomonadaceae bacterium]
MITKRQKEQIAIETIKVLYCQIKEISETINFSQTKTYIETFFNSLFDRNFGTISLSSWMHGLNTSLGQSFFERTAYILSSSKKKVFKGNKISELQIAEVSRIITNLQNRANDVKPNLQIENERIWSGNYGDEDFAHDFTIDIFWEDEKEVVGIEAKTVRPNSDISKQTKDKILRAKCVLKKLYPDKNVKYFYGFPFDPFGMNSTTSDKGEFMKKNVNFSKYFAEDEVLLASEFWDFISGTPNTMETILEIINAIATTEFPAKLKFIQNKSNAEDYKKAYLSLLNLWQLNREKLLVENESRVKQKIAGNRALTRVFNQDVFNNKGEYNENRVDELLVLI